MGSAAGVTAQTSGTKCTLLFCFGKKGNREGTVAQEKPDEGEGFCLKKDGGARMSEEQGPP